MKDTASKRKPIGYGHDDNSPVRKMDMSKARETSKEFAAGSPHPHANQDEGPAGRVVLGSHEIGVKEEPFNRCRAQADDLGKKGSK